MTVGHDGGREQKSQILSPQSPAVTAPSQRGLSTDSHVASLLGMTEMSFALHCYK